jgi:hypothetical protein
VRLCVLVMPKSARRKASGLEGMIWETLTAVCGRELQRSSFGEANGRCCFGCHPDVRITHIRDIDAAQGHLIIKASGERFATEQARARGQCAGRKRLGAPGSDREFPAAGTGYVVAMRYKACPQA